MVALQNLWRLKSDMFEFIASNMFQNFVLNLFMFTLLMIIIIGISAVVCIIIYDLIMTSRKHQKQAEEVKD